MSEIRETVFGGKEWPAHLTYVPAVRAGNMVWLSGTTGTDDDDRRITAPGDIVEQTRQIYRKFEKLLNSVGGSCDDIVQTHDFITTTENYKGTAAVRREFFKTAQPTSTGVLVAGLLRKDALIEISAVAVLRNGTTAERTPMSVTSRFYEEFEVGKRYPTTSRLITLEDHLAFCKLVRYDVPLFIDEEAAKRTPFGGIICPSHLIMSFSTAMTGGLFSESILGLLAIERARFLAPVRPGDTIRTEVEVIEKKNGSDPSRGIITFRDHVFNQRGELVFQNDKIALIKRRKIGSE